MSTASIEERERKHWGWGYADEQPDEAALRATAKLARAHLGYAPQDVELPVALQDVSLPPPRLRPPAELASLCDGSVRARARHAMGCAYRDVVRGFRGEFPTPPDVVAYPDSEAALERVLEWALGAGAAVIPYGGGTSVVGGVEPRGGDRYEGVVTIDMRRLGRVLEIDATSLSARIQGGALGPALERELGQQGLTLRHFPQSFALSTLGGWIATRAGGHFSTVETHIDDLVEGVRALTPSGWWESRRLPGSGAGVSPDRMLIGSEGVLGLITEAWMRVRPRPRFRASAGVRFARWGDGVQAARALAQSRLYPSAARLIDAEEARITGAGDGSAALLVLGFESDLEQGAVDDAMRRALAICHQAGGATPTGAPASARASAEGPAASAGGAPTPSSGVGQWREAFLRAPYLRDMLVAAGVISETFETAITWERLDWFRDAVLARVEDVLREVCGGGSVTCRFTHLYPDGAAPYFTVLAPARRGHELEQWDQIKAAASDAVLAGGGTITHHHAVGRDHRPWYDRQRPDPFAAALRAAKAALDPRGALNPGVLVDPVDR